MKQSLLVYNPDGSTLTFPLEVSAVKIGRAADNDIVLVDADRSVSRWHATINTDAAGRVSVTDLNSSNGTRVNGRLVESECPLTPTDTVQLGQFRMVLTEDPAEDVRFAIQAGAVELADLQKTSTLLPAALPESAISDELRNLELLYEVGMKLVRSRSIEEVAEAAVELLFRIARVDRVAVMQWDEERNASGSSELHLRDTGKAPEGLAPANDPSSVILNRTILNRMRRDNRPLLIRGSKAAPEYLADTMMVRAPSAELLRSLLDGGPGAGSEPGSDNIRAAFCAPLSCQGRFHGVLYADNLSEPDAFSEADFRIFSSIAAQAGLALANAIANRQLMRREVERQALKLYLPPQVADRILASGGVAQLQGIVQPVAVLYADIRGFTTMSEQMEARQLVHMLNEFFTAMSEAIFDCNGTLDKFIGDCIMALFGAPVESARAPWEALAAAIRMQRAMRRLNIDRQSRNQAPFQIGIGLHYGPAVVGNIGSADRVQYTAIGDTVNVAARLVAMASPGEIIVSEDVRAALPGYEGFDRLGEVELKGRTGKLNLYTARWPEIPLE